ncbi:TIGR02147 family protein [Bacteriovoracaceae bacterium]|nr:TIGR02147 family protein [Bacteriovoracaceae bacterium]
MEIYLFEKSSDFLCHKYLEKKKKNPSFSIRSWAKQLGLNSHGNLQQIINGKRTSPKKFVPLFGKSFELHEKEIEYLDTLIDLEKSKTSDQREIFRKKIEAMRPSHSRITAHEMNSDLLLKDPLYIIIRTMLEREDFILDLDWIKSKIRLDVTNEQIEMTIKKLVELGLAEFKEGTLVKTYRHVKNKIDIPSDIGREFHRNMAEFAGREIHLQDMNNREYSSFCFNIRPESMEKAKEKIRRFVVDFMEEFEAAQNTSSETYHLNVQFFSSTYNQSLISNSEKVQ